MFECWEWFTKQDHQALLKAKYCPRVAAALFTQKKNAEKTHVTLNVNLYDLEIQYWVLRLSRYMCVQNFIKVSAAIHELSTVH